MKKLYNFCIATIFLLCIIGVTSCMELYDDYEVSETPTPTPQPVADDPNLYVASSATPGSSGAATGTPGSENGDGTIDHPFNTLQAAINRINISTTPNLDWNIYIDGTVEGCTTISGLNNASSLTISKAGSTAGLNGAGSGRVISISCNKPIVIDHITIFGGTTTQNENGGGISISNYANVTFSSGTIRSCTASGDGGGVYIASGGSFTLVDGTIRTNCANKGAGIYNQGTLTLSGNYIIRENTANDTGGGIYNTGTINPATIDDTKIYNNYKGLNEDSSNVEP